jgi:putative inorganic carbon (HCO3(-)) transporter
MSATVFHRTAPSLTVGRTLLAASSAVLIGAGLASRTPALVVLAAVPVLVAVIARPEGATVVFVFVFYLNVPVLLAHATGVTAFGSAAALLLTIPAVAYVLLRREALVLTPALGLMVVYLTVLVISAVHGGSSQVSAGGVNVFLTEGLLLYLLVTNSVRTPEVLRGVIWALLAAGATMGAISVWQEVTHSYSNTLGGLAQVAGAEGVPVRADRARELAGPIGEQNRYAQVLLVLLPLAVWAARVERRTALRLAAAAAAGLILSGVLLTFSRGAGVALVVVALAMLATGFVRLRHVLALAVALSVLTVVVAPDYVQRLESLSQLDAATATDRSGIDSSLRGRATENLAALHAFSDHPMIGVGPGQFFAVYSQRYANTLDLRYLETRRRAHNLYLELAADTGILGLLAFLAIVGTTMFQLWRLAGFWAASWRPELADLARALVLALLGYVTSALFLQLSYQRYFWFLIALANAAIWVLRREEARAANAAAGGRMA